MFGKNGANLPMFGKTQPVRGKQICQCLAKMVRICQTLAKCKSRASTLLTSLLLTSYFAVAAAAALAKRLSRAVGKV
jgi:hypothetical protein